MVRAFVRQEAVLSSRVEGTHTSLEQLYTYEAVQFSFLPCAPDAREVYNYVQALDFGFERLETLLGELMNDPDPEKARRVTVAMLQMKKLDIGGLKRAYEGV